MRRAFPRPFNVGTLPTFPAILCDLTKAATSLHPHPRGPTAFVFVFCLASNREPIVVTVTGAAGQIAYSLLFSLGKGDVFGPDQPVRARRRAIGYHAITASLTASDCLIYAS